MDQASPSYIYDAQYNGLVRRDPDFDIADETRIFNEAFQAYMNDSRTNALEIFNENYPSTVARQSRLQEPYVAPPALRLEYNSVGLDQTRNERRNYHPRAFDKPGDDCTRIRLLKVVLLEKDDDSSSSIECYFLNPRRFASKAFWERIKYTALSYTWGSAAVSDDVKDILIHNKPVCVRRNLWDFLHTMRQARIDGPFWIDALCIDQLKTAEKERQLRLMPNIYAEASTVLIWLGTYGEEEAQGVLQLHDRYSKGKLQGKLDRIAHYYALQYLVKNKYWTRLWVVQEIFMARKLRVYTGALRWDFSDLTRISREPDPDIVAIDWSNWNSIVEAKETWKHQPLALHEALFRWSHQDCGVTHDKVYGLLGLVAKPQIKIDLSISILDLFEEVLRLERKVVYARGYKYSRDFTTKLLKSLGMEGVEDAERIKTDFLGGWRE